MNDEELAYMGFLATVAFLFGCTLFFSIQYALYQPYFNLGWEKTQCYVQNIQNYQILWYYDDGLDQTFYAKYSLLNVLVDIDGVMRRGFACGSTLSTLGSGQQAFDKKFPYQYGNCIYPNECGNQMIMPMWFCSDCQTCEHLKKEEKQDCWWFLKDDQGIVDDVDDLPIGYELEVPVESSVFIQASFREQPYYNEGEYLTLWIIVFGVLMIVPGLIAIICCGGALFVYCKG